MKTEASVDKSDTVVSQTTTAANTCSSSSDVILIYYAQQAKHLDNKTHFSQSWN